MKWLKERVWKKRIHKSCREGWTSASNSETYVLYTYGHHVESDFDVYTAKPKKIGAKPVYYGAEAIMRHREKVLKERKQPLTSAAPRGI